MTAARDLMDTSDAPLPGLESPAPSRVSRLELEVTASFARLQDEGLIDDRHRGLVELGLVLARRIGAGSGGKDYGVAQLSAQLVGVYQQLMPDQEGGSSDGFDEWRRALADLDNGGQPAPVGHPG